MIELQREISIKENKDAPYMLSSKLVNSYILPLVLSTMTIKANDNAYDQIYVLLTLLYLQHIFN